jgi:hypothetical protein
VQKFWIYFPLTLLLWWSGNAVGQRQGTTTLAVNVVPESQVDPSRVSLRFVVSGDGRDEVISQPTLVTARVRALPGQQIHLTAAVSSVSGPADGAKAARFEWSGTMVRASGEVRTATCTNGAFPDDGPQELVAGWSQSGSLTCGFSFRLANPSDLPPGTYTAVFALALQTR